MIKNILKIKLREFNICVKNIKSWYSLELQNDNATWHHNVLYNYIIINMNL
jgi:hypothetical protein